MDGSSAHGHAGNPYRYHAGRRARSRRNRAAAVYGFVQQLLDQQRRPSQSHAAHSVAGGADLQLLGYAVQEPGRTGMGGGSGTGGAGFDRQSYRPKFFLTAGSAIGALQNGYWNGSWLRSQGESSGRRAG